MSLSFALNSGDLKEFGLAKTSLSFTEAFPPLNSNLINLGSFGSIDNLKEVNNSLDLGNISTTATVKTEKSEQSTQPTTLSASISNALSQPNSQTNARYLEITQYLTLTQVITSL